MQQFTPKRWCLSTKQYPACIAGAGLPPSYTQLGTRGGFYFRGHWVLYGNVPSCH